jgi:CubicO group peptidase (beta-lactamase class C family)
MGYLTWIPQAHGDHAFAAMGSGGQLVEVVPDLRMVVVVVSDGASGNNAPPDAYAELVGTVLVPHA